MTTISLSRIHYPVSTLGPGNRIGVWFQGCSIRCPGCISVDTWVQGKGQTTISHVVEQVREWASLADGLTISGGEPFEQPEALEALVREWRDLSSSDVLIFTGFSFDRVQPALSKIDGLVDAVVTGPYRQEATQTLALRGSDNQELHILTARGQKFSAFERKMKPSDRALDVMFDTQGQVWFAGIPFRDDFSRLQQLLANDGHTMRMPGIG